MPDLETLARLVEAGQLTPVIGKTYPLHQAPDAMRHLQAGQARGKLVLKVTGAGCAAASSWPAGRRARAWKAP